MSFAKDVHTIFSKIEDFLRTRDRFLLTTHVRPDGDCIASTLLMTYVLESFRKEYRVIIDDVVPSKFDFLSGIQRIESFDETGVAYSPKAVIVLDATSLDRIGRVAKLVGDAPTVNIDHHASNVQFGTLNLVGEESSTAEVVYSLIRHLGMPVSAEMAATVYTGIVCDTGRFLFPNTTLESLSVCRDMVAHGASPDYIGEKVYCRTSQETIRALAEALATVEFHSDGAVASMYLKNGCVCDAVDTEGFVDHLLSIEGTEVEFFMCEIAPKVFRVSLRSKQYVDVNAVAALFGGGGHKRASGCTVEGSVEEVKRRILEVVEKHL